MTTLEYIAISLLALLFILFLMFVLGIKKNTMLLTLLNGSIAIGVYLVLITFKVLSPTHIMSLFVGMLGNIYLLALPFI